MTDMTTDTRAALYDMQAPTQLSSDDMKQLLEHYRLTPDEYYVSHKHLPGGLSNSNYRLETSSRLLLVKGCDNKTHDELDAQIRALIGLKQSPNAPPIAYPVKQTNATGKSTESSAYIYQSPSISKPIVVYDYLNGKPPNRASSGVMRQLGRALAALHNVPVDSFLYLPQFPMGIAEMDPFLNVEIVSQSSELQNNSFVSFLRTHITELKPLLKSDVLKSKQSVVHGDLFLENVVFTCDDPPQLLGLIDFEEMCIAHTILDVAMTIVGCCYNDNDELDWELTREFLHEYQQSKSLSDAEKQAFPQFLSYACLSIAFWRFRQFVVRTPDAMRKDSYLSMVRRIERIDADRLCALLF